MKNTTHIRLLFLCMVTSITSCARIEGSFTCTNRDIKDSSRVIYYWVDSDSTLYVSQLPEPDLKKQNVHWNKPDKETHRLFYFALAQEELINQTNGLDIEKSGLAFSIYLKIKPDSIAGEFIKRLKKKCE